MKSVGMRTSRPRPIQKRAKRMAPPTAKATVEAPKMVKRRRGRKLKMSCAERKDWIELQERLAIFALKLKEEKRIEAKTATYKENGPGAGQLDAGIVGSLAGVGGHDAVERRVGEVDGAGGRLLHRGGHGGAVCACGCCLLLCRRHDDVVLGRARRRWRE